MRVKSPWLLLLSAAGICFNPAVRAADFGNGYLEPKSLAGTIYSDASLNHVLFTFHRTATNSGSTVHVLREFYLPDGTVAARERVVYESRQLKSYSLEDLQAGSKGSAVVQSTSGELKLNFDYVQGGSKKTGSERLVPNILINDMVGPFIASHWDDLVNGATVKCRMVALSRLETVGFKFFKETESTWHGKPVLVIKLQPSSVIIAQLVAPLHFMVEKDSPHRVLQYTGRTTPKILKNSKWEDLDATTVFDW